MLERKDGNLIMKRQQAIHDTFQFIRDYWRLPKAYLAEGRWWEAIETAVVIVWIALT